MPKSDPIKGPPLQFETKTITVMCQTISNSLGKTNNKPKLTYLAKEFNHDQLISQNVFKQIQLEAA
jgi:hypothetical protein